MSSSENNSAPVVVGLLGILLLAGRSCDDLFRNTTRVVSHAPSPASIGRVDEAIEIGGRTGNNLSEATVEIPHYNYANAIEPEVVVPQQVAGEIISTFRAGIHTRVSINRPARAPKLLTLFPQNAAEYLAVYGVEPTASATAQIRALDRLFSDGPDVDRLEAGMQLLEVLNRYDDSSPVVILGHSEEEGAVLVLPTGERIGVVKLHEACQTAGTNCIVLTCYGEDLGITKELAPEDAYAMWQAAYAKNQTQRLTIAEFSFAMRQDQLTRESRRKIAVSGVGVGVSVTGGVYVYVSTRDR